MNEIQFSADDWQIIAVLIVLAAIGIGMIVGIGGHIVDEGKRRDDGSDWGGVDYE
jgi:hypothetical protein